MRLVVCLLMVLVAGCLDDGASDGAIDETAGGAADDAAAVPVEQARVSAELGTATGGPSPPGSFAFTVTVPEGGAMKVAWELGVQLSSVASNAHIAGPGCGVPAAGGVAVAVGGRAVRAGECAELAAGEHEFTVVLDQPVVGWDATVRGRVVDA